VIGDVTDLVFVLHQKGHIQTLSRSYLKFAYRESNLMGYWIVAASLTLRLESAESVQSRMQHYLEYRTKTQPLATNNCGSVFRNPVGHSAGALIEKVGLKGFQLGGARFSDKHANFILNEKGATAHDVNQLISLAQAKVKEQCQVTLDPEVKLVGDWSE
jgi:UDP-N-acetylmuramate dehydrogenase